MKFVILKMADIVISYLSEIVYMKRIHKSATNAISIASNVRKQKRNKTEMETEKERI
jgi:hypothetical protein